MLPAAQQTNPVGLPLPPDPPLPLPQMQDVLPAAQPTLQAVAAAVNGSVDALTGCAVDAPLTLRTPGARSGVGGGARGVGIGGVGGSSGGHVASGSVRGGPAGTAASHLQGAYLTFPEYSFSGSRPMRAVPEAGVYFERYAKPDGAVRRDTGPTLPAVQQYYLRPDRATLVALAAAEMEATKVWQVFGAQGGSCVGMRLLGGGQADLRGCLVCLRVCVGPWGRVEHLALNRERTVAFRTDVWDGRKSAPAHASPSAPSFDPEPFDPL
eukprot:360229-Chlamydomonas_euryale.AAC.1